MLKSCSECDWETEVSMTGFFEEMGCAAYDKFSDLITQHERFPSLSSKAVTNCFPKS